VVVGIGAAIGSTHSAVLTLLAAALIALAFNPVRERAKRLANRIVYGKRATPYEVMSEFAQRMGGGFLLEDVIPRTAQILAQGTGAVPAVVWVKNGDQLHAEGSWPNGEAFPDVPIVEADRLHVPDMSRTVAVRHEGELLGALSIRKPAGEPVSAIEDKLLADVASQAGLLLRNVLLVDDLRASRQRIVAAQDAAARRLERNIHDGAQQQLVALAVKLGLVQRLAGQDPAKVQPMLGELRDDAQDALENLRDLARGIYPPLLADKGLAAALEAQARRSATPTEVRSDGIGRYPQETEAALYFCALEALQNVAKYSNAAHAVVGLSQVDGWLSFTVSDDGIGFDTAKTNHGTGMQGMADRLAAVGGELRVSSEPGSGTIVQGRVPVGDPGSA
jgi:signal transduction histidine kinase